MRTLTSKLTKHHRATIPKRIRTLLDLEPGDTVAFEIDGGKVRLRKAHPVDTAFATGIEATLSEWDSPADENAYRAL
jgi:AbrB family looped-hinge helix DNA binding protein